MERLVSTIVLAFAVAGFAQAPVRDSPPLESEPTGIINGRVVAADTGEVIRKARITINGSGPFKSQVSSLKSRVRLENVET